MDSTLSLIPRPGPCLVDDGLVSASQAAALAGISYRQLDYWLRVGLLDSAVPGNGSGSRRRFDSRDVADARLAALLMRLHGDTVWAGRVLESIRHLPLAEWGDHTLVIHPDGRSEVDGYVADVGVVVRLGVCVDHAQAA